MNGGGPDRGARDAAGRGILLHVCCGPCASHCLSVLQADYKVTLFFSNSNIWPREEYDKRLASARKLAALCGVPLVEDKYDHDAWLALVDGLEAEPEGGGRCELCFAFNLGRAARYAGEHGFDLFTTSLTVSPHKSSPVIFKAGEAEGAFLKADFKKKDGFRQSVEFSKAYDLYRQDYCGCEFSRKRK